MYWISQTENGINYTDSITITVNQSDTSLIDIVACENYTWGTVHIHKQVHTSHLLLVHQTIYP